MNHRQVFRNDQTFEARKRADMAAVEGNLDSQRASEAQNRLLGQETRRLCVFCLAEGEAQGSRRSTRRRFNALVQKRISWYAFREIQKRSGAA